MLLGHRIEMGTDHEPEGNWTEWQWDGRRLRVTNARIAAYPLFYCVTDTSIALSPSIDRLLALGASRSLDFDALAAFLAVGYYLGADTPFSSIRALPPSSTLTWRPGGLTISGSPPPIMTVSMTRDAAIDGLIERVRTAVERRIPAQAEPFLMPLSGGRDSRHILLELRRQGAPPSLCLTTHHYAVDWGGDVPYAERLCAELGLPQRILEPGPFVRAEWRKNRLTGYATDEHAWFLPVADALVGATPYTYEGFGGSLAFRRAYIKRTVRRLSRERRWDDLARWMGKKDAGEARFTSLLRRRLRRELSAERAAARIRRELERHLGSDEPYLSYYIFDRSFREIGLLPNAMLAGVPAVYTPFMDADVLAFSTSVPGKHVDATFHDEIIARAFPEVAHVPFNPKQAPHPDRGFMRRTDRDLLRMLLGRSDGSILDKPGLTARAMWGGLSGDAWFGWGRRMALTVYLAQLEALVAGRVSVDPSSPA